MSDPGASTEPRQRPANNDPSPARPTEPGPALRSNPDRQAEAAVPQDPQLDAEKRADRASRETDTVPGKTRDHPERKHRKRDLYSKAAETGAEVSRTGKTPWAVDASKSKGELYHEAKAAGIEGRSAMNKEQLVEALRKHRAMNSSGEPATRQAPTVGGQAPIGRQIRSDGDPPRSDAESAEALGADARRADRCVIVYKRSHRYGEFEVVATESNGSRRSVARSPAFRARSSRVPQWRRSVRRAHALLAWRLEACGWRSLGSGGRWHELRFVRACAAGVRPMRSVVTLVREPGRARFVAEELDSYGNPTPLLVSPPFSAPRFLRVRRSRRTRAALKQLVMQMESHGWKVAAAVGKDWYAISLWRPVRAKLGSRVPGSRPERPAAGPA
jgi:hypothetical protein